MCGIVGIYDLTASTPQEQLLATATAMADTVAHRGPDDAGVWADERAGLALGHRRLAIRDLSPTGHQPMVSSCGRYVIVYNGEIYSQDAIVRDLGARVRTLRGHLRAVQFLFGGAGASRQTPKRSPGRRKGTRVPRPGRPLRA